MAGVGRPFLIALLFASSACGESTSSTSSDAGMEAPAADAGEPEADSGSSFMLDAGSSPADSGEPPPSCGTLTACGLICTNLDSDPTNCGRCGRTCIIPNAVAGCSAGECVIDRCADGFLDVDQSVETGCEVEDMCTPDEACTTSCNSEGSITCSQGIGTCVPPAEACNLIDDDCNSECDEGPIAGCRSPVHRAYGNGHLYTTDLNQASTSPFSLESMNYFYLYAQPVPETRPLFLCRKGDGTYIATTDTCCEMIGSMERTLGYLSPVETCGAAPLYRLYNSTNNDHFFTTSAAERDNAVAMFGYVSEGITGYIWTSP